MATNSEQKAFRGKTVHLSFYCFFLNQFFFIRSISNKSVKKKCWRLSIGDLELEQVKTCEIKMILLKNISNISVAGIHKNIFNVENPLLTSW